MKSIMWKIINKIRCQLINGDEWRFVKTFPPPNNVEVLATDGEHYSVGKFTEKGEVFDPSSAFYINEEDSYGCQFLLVYPSYWLPLKTLSKFQKEKALLRKTYLEKKNKIYTKKIRMNGKEGFQQYEITKIYKEALSDDWEPFK